MIDRLLIGFALTPHNWFVVSDLPGRRIGCCMGRLGGSLFVEVRPCRMVAGCHVTQRARFVKGAVRAHVG